MPKAKSGEKPEDRRAFLEKAGKMTAAAPAATLLLSANSRRAMAAQYTNSGNCSQDYPGNGKGKG